MKKTDYVFLIIIGFSVLLLFAAVIIFDNGYHSVDLSYNMYLSAWDAGYTLSDFESNYCDMYTVNSCMSYGDVYINGVEYLYDGLRVMAFAFILTLISALYFFIRNRELSLMNKYKVRSHG